MHVYGNTVAMATGKTCDRGRGSHTQEMTGGNSSVTFRVVDCFVKFIPTRR